MAYVAVLGERRKTETKPVERRHAIKISTGLGKFFLTISTIALAVVLSILYFMQINRITLSGYQINDLERQIRAYREENKKISYQVAQRKALTIVEREAKERLQMVSTGQIEYYWSANQELALRQ
ncbi:MAG TPA: hypothetical protein ENN77_00080 [Candidatus Wirthbacteria bacterium]|nr:hypothetical protein [Candidatus Wirthbacteria bacterium]